MISSIGQVAITVADIKRSIAFYRDAVGLPFLFEAGPSMAFLQCGGVRLMLSLPEGGAQHASIFYFKTDGIEAEAAGMKARGVEFERDPHLIARMPDHELWMAFFRDPDGNLMGLMEERRPAI